MSTPAATAFAALAGNACTLFAEAEFDSREAALQELVHNLSTLYAAASVLPEVPTRSDDFPHRADPVAALAVAQRWQHQLGDLDLYELPDEDGETMPGRISDDLGHIYSDLQEGLKVLEVGLPRREAQWIWRYGFWHHWGYHIVDVLTVAHDVLAEDDS